MIQEIVIQNFKSIKDLKFELKPINVLIGPNGAGKSNFVNFFSFVYAIYDQRLSTYTSEKGGADRILYLGRKVSSSVSGRINFDNTNEYFFELMPNQQSGFYFQKEGDNFNMSKAYQPGRGWSFTIYDRGHNESVLRNLDSSRAGYVKKYLESFRVYHFHDTSSSAPLKQTARLDDNRFLRADGSNLPAFLYKLQQQNILAYNRVEAVIKLIAPYFDRFDLQPNGEYIRLNWRQKNTDIYLDASDLSDGTIRFIALCTLLAQPDPPKTIIIDEPELGLHPYAISVLASLVKSVRQPTQVILSTQSVNLVNEFDPEDVIIVENQENESIFKRLEKATLTDWLAEYTLSELWNKNVLGGNP
ncbi:AAA family ATPase [Spirosoma flavus]